MRVTSGSWDGEKVFLKDQVLEVRHAIADARLHVAAFLGDFLKKTKICLGSHCFSDPSSLEGPRWRRQPIYGHFVKPTL
jgi:hypothetical protein